MMPAADIMAEALAETELKGSSRAARRQCDRRRDQRPQARIKRLLVEQARRMVRFSARA